MIEYIFDIRLLPPRQYYHLFLLLGLPFFSSMDARANPWTGDGQSEAIMHIEAPSSMGITVGAGFVVDGHDDTQYVVTTMSNLFPIKKDDDDYLAQLRQQYPPFRTCHPIDRNFDLVVRQGGKGEPPPLKWSILRYGSEEPDEEDQDAEEEAQG